MKSYNIGDKVSLNDLETGEPFIGTVADVRLDTINTDDGDKDSRLHFIAHPARSKNFNSENGIDYYCVMAISFDEPLPVN